MPTKTLKSLEKGIDLLFLFSQDRPVMTLLEIAAALQLPQSSAYRLLATFQKKRVIARDHRTRMYGLDTNLLRLQGALCAHLDIARLALPDLEVLAAASGETSHLFLLQGNEVVCAESVSSPNTIRFMPEKGKGLPLHAPAAGRAVLAFLSEEFLRRYIRERGLPALTPHTVTDPEALRALLAEVRGRGFAVSFQQMYLGARGVAVPVFRQPGEVLGSLGVSGPDPRFTEEDALALVPMLQERSRRLAIALGAPGEPQPSAAVR